MLETLAEDLISKGLTNIRIQTSDHWHSFQQGLRASRLGIYFAPPHFAAWAISKHGFKPLVRLSEPISYVIATKTAKPRIFEINDLAGRSVCSGKPLNLDYLLINRALGNRLPAATIKVVNSVEKQMRNPATLCEAFSISNHQFEKTADAVPGEFIKLYQSTNYNNYVFVAHPDVSEKQISKLQHYLLNLDSQALLSPMLLVFAAEAKLLRSSPDDYPSDYWRVLTPYWGGDAKSRIAD
ncbi:MAG: PhnD/SsuA/transferrin family substrate-binding protein [Gammaproteobacteria bacterium]|nr:PhnD/SsuA/transferrin family substrate-binding protein [Gammaproteobacteria bacterium]